MRKVSITMIAILLFVQILSNGFAQIPNISDEETLEDGFEMPSQTSSRNNSSGNNTAPQVSSVIVTPSSPTETDVLACYYTYSDIDNDPDMSSITWSINGVLTTSVGSTLSSGYTTGDYVTCTVSAYDGTDYGNTASTDVLIISSNTGGNNTGGNNTGGNNTGGNNSSTHNDAHCLIVSNFTINLTYYVTLDLVNTCSKDIYYPGINATADHSGVSGFSSQANWWYLIYANGTYNMSWQLSFDSSVQNGTNITLDFEAAILNCGANGTWHDCPNSNSSSLSYQFAFSSINNNNTGGNNNNSNCGNYSNLTDMVIWSDYTNYTVGDTVNMGYDVSCTVLGNNYTIDSYLRNTTTVLYGGSPWFGWTAQWNPMQFSDYNANFDAGDYCLNATLYEFGVFLDFEETCFTIVNDTGNGTGNNTGGNNSSNCGNYSSWTDLMLWTDATTYAVGDNVLGSFFVNCTINGETYQLDYEVVEYNTNIEHYNGEWNWTEQNNWEAFNPIWSGLPAGDYCIYSTLVIWTGSAYSFVDFEAPCFNVWNSTNGNNTGGNNSTNPCGNNSSLISVLSWTDSSTYQLGDDQELSFYVNCTIIGNEYSLEYYVTEVGATNWSDAGLWTWIAGQTYSFFTDIIGGLGEGDYCVIGNLYEWNSYAADDGGNTCFTILAGNNTGGNNTGNNTGQPTYSGNLIPSGNGGGVNTQQPCWYFSDTISIQIDMDGLDSNVLTYLEWELLEAGAIIDSGAPTIYTDSNGEISYLWQYDTSQLTLNGLTTYGSIGNYVIMINPADDNLSNLFPSSPYYYTVQVGNCVNGSNNTWTSNATLDVALAYHQWAGSYDTEQWLMVSQMTSGANYEVVWTLETCNGFNWMDSGTWSFTGVANQMITDFSIQPGWYCLVLEGELFENGNSVDWDSDTIWCNCSNGLNTTSYPNNTAPQISSVLISPSSATENDVLTCTYTYYDLENDPDLSGITWTINGASTTTVGPTLSSGYTTGDFVTCIVAAFDGTDYGNVGSTTALIMTNSSGSSGNGIPSVGVVGTIAAISAGFIFTIRREDEE